MSFIPTLLTSLDARLDELATEISTLHEARDALQTRTLTASRTRSTNGRATTKPARRSTAKTTTPTSTPTSTPTLKAPPAAAVAKAAPATPPAAAKPKSAPRAAGRQAARSAKSNGRAGVSLSGEQLERLLIDAGSAVSAAAIAQQADAPRNRVLALLRELEASGKVRRSGQRRSTLWMAITNEDRISERAKELERQFAAPRANRTQRRGRARAS